jgi:hypothetical protein
MNLLWLIVLTSSIQSTPPDEWTDYTQPLDDFFSYDLFDRDIFEELGVARGDCKPEFPAPSGTLEPLPSGDLTIPIPEKSLSSSPLHTHNNETRMPPTITAMAVLQAQRNYELHSPVTYTMNPQYIVPVLPQSSALANFKERAIWFFKGRYQYTALQTSIWNVQPVLVFSRRYYQGMVNLDEKTFHMSGKNSAMGCRASQDQLLLLDGYRKNHSDDRTRDKTWITRSLSKATLEIGEFRKQYPLIVDGLVVALSGGNQLLTASYGKPPLGAILLRSDGEWLTFIGGSSDDTVKTLDVQDDDIVIVGPLKGISELESGTLRLKASSTPDAITETTYDLVSNRTFCIVATISNTAILQSKKAKPRSPSGSRLRKIKAANSPSSASSLLKKAQPKRASSISSSKSPPSASQADKQNEYKRHIHKDATRQKRPEPSVERTIWFHTAGKLYNYSQHSIKGMLLPFVFSQRYYQGGVSFTKRPFYIFGKNSSIGYRITQDRILLLGGYGTKRSSNQRSDKTWATREVNEAALKSDEFPKHYPLISDGLVVALKGNQLLVASYGKPPLGAILLRPDGEWLKFIGESADDTVKAIDTHNNDIAIVGPLKGISKLESGTIQLKASSALEAIAKTVYDSAGEKSMCIVVTISVGKLATESETRTTTPSLSSKPANQMAEASKTAYPPSRKVANSSYPSQIKVRPLLNSSDSLSGE